MQRGSLAHTECALYVCVHTLSTLNATDRAVCVCCCRYNAHYMGYQPSGCCNVMSDNLVIGSNYTPTSCASFDRWQTSSRYTCPATTSYISLGRVGGWDVPACRARCEAVGQLGCCYYNARRPGVYGFRVGQTERTRLSRSYHTHLRPQVCAVHSYVAPGVTACGLLRRAHGRGEANPERLGWWTRRPSGFWRTGSGGALLRERAREERVRFEPTAWLCQDVGGVPARGTSRS